jgi:hypothetical protein
MLVNYELGRSWNEAAERCFMANLLLKRLPEMAEETREHSQDSFYIRLL